MKGVSQIFILSFILINIYRPKLLTAEYMAISADKNELNFLFCFVFTSE